MAATARFSQKKQLNTRAEGQSLSASHQQGVAGNLKRSDTVTMHAGTKRDQSSAGTSCPMALRKTGSGTLPVPQPHHTEEEKVTASPVLPLRWSR